LKNQKFPDNFDDDLIVHDALVVVHSMENDGNQYTGLDNLIKALKERDYPFKIYHCYNSTDLKAVFQKKTSKYIWIFGHGWRGGVTFKWKRSLSERILFKKKQSRFVYSELYKTQDLFPKKVFIGQFHCNHLEKEYDNTPLPSILLQDDESGKSHFITNSHLNSCSIWFATRDLVKNISRRE